MIQLQEEMNKKGEAYKAGYKTICEIGEECICRAGKKVFSVENGYLIACFDDGVTEETVTEIAKRHPFYAVFRDSGLASGSVVVNFEQIFEIYSPKMQRKVL